METTNAWRCWGEHAMRPGITPHFSSRRSRTLIRLYLQIRGRKTPSRSPSWSTSVLKTRPSGDLESRICTVYYSSPLHSDELHSSDLAIGRAEGEIYACAVVAFARAKRSKRLQPIKCLACHQWHRVFGGPLDARISREFGARP